MKGANGIKLMLVDDEPHILQFLELGLVNEFPAKLKYRGATLAFYECLLNVC